MRFDATTLTLGPFLWFGSEPGGPAPSLGDAVAKHTKGDRMTPLAIELAQREPDPEAMLRARSLMHPIPRAGKLEEMGGLAVYLASDLSSFVTGQAIAIDGGYSIR
jgi:NAD(P)-dependent dehydrogenase (short-subunit alcohol dehydrogenase family)